MVFKTFSNWLKLTYNHMCSFINTHVQERLSATIITEKHCCSLLICVINRLEVNNGVFLFIIIIIITNFNLLGVTSVQTSMHIHMFCMYICTMYAHIHVLHVHTHELYAHMYIQCMHIHIYCMYTCTMYVHIIIYI